MAERAGLCAIVELSPGHSATHRVILHMLRLEGHTDAQWPQDTHLSGGNCKKSLTGAEVLLLELQLQVKEAQLLVLQQ